MGVPISHSRFRKEKGYDIPLFADEKWTVFGLLGKPTLPAKKIMLDLTKNWKRVIDSLYKGIMVIDTGGAIRHVNPALERLTGYRADELMGNTHHACVLRLRTLVRPGGILVRAVRQRAGHETDGLPDQRKTRLSHERDQTGIDSPRCKRRYGRGGGNHLGYGRSEAECFRELLFRKYPELFSLRGT